jgi:UDP-GlcNAc:undecaprenyl-phosphate/decaprenyl-phosphate GlcNAc-1-phosphate transferase
MVLKDLLIGIKNMNYDYILYVFLLQILIYFFFKKKLLKAVIKFKLIDRPGKNKIHKKNIPVTGGLIIFLSLNLYIFFSYFISYFGIKLLDEITAIFFSGAFFVFLIGIIDDIIPLTPQKKIIIITIFNILLFQNVSFFQTNVLIFDNVIISGNINITSLSLIISVFGFLGYHYALVIIDGINGLFGAYIVALLMLVLIYFDLDYKLKNLIFYLTLSLCFVTALNLKGSLFLGNSGSLMLGTIIPYLLIYLYNDREHSYSIFAFVSLIIIPVIDMVKLFFIRILNRKSPFQKDLKHFHHLLIARYSLHTTLFFYLVLCFLPFIFMNHFRFDPLICVLFQIVAFFGLSFNLNKK